MRRVLHISKYYYPYIGGVEDVCFNIVKILKRQSEIEQQVFCFNDRNETINDTFDGIPICRVAVRKIVASQPISTCYGKELKRIIKQFKPTHIHFHAPNPLGAFALLPIIPNDVKLFTHWHSDIVAQKLIYSIIKPVENRILKRSNLILATSPAYINNSKPLLKWNEKVEVLPNIIDPEKFILSPKCEEQITLIKNRYNNLPIILFVGRHVTYKGVFYLIEAAKLIKTPCMIVVGGKGPLSDELKAMAQHIDNVTFIGRIEENELAAYFHAADIFTFPSITKNEAFGVALAEAMYCMAVPITFTIKGSGVNWVNIHNETGIEVENSNFVELGKAVDQLLNNRLLMEKYAINGRCRIEQNMVAPVIEEKLNAIYK